MDTNALDTLTDRNLAGAPITRKGQPAHEREARQASTV
jgi:hypothetical protein